LLQQHDGSDAAVVFTEAWERILVKNCLEAKDPSVPVDLLPGP
jgi:hypothetical protein